MKKIAVVAVLVMTLLSLGMAFAFENEPEGFRDLKWGDPPTEKIEGLIELAGRGKVYIRPSDKLYLGDAQLRTIWYSFYQDKFMRVSLYFKGKHNYDLLETICRERYGEETTSELYKLYWLSGQTSVDLSYDFTEDEGALSLADWELLQEWKDVVDKELKTKRKSTK